MGRQIRSEDPAWLDVELRIHQNHRRDAVDCPSLLSTGSRISDVPGVMEPTLEFLKLIVYLAQNALDRSERGVADGRGVENQNKSGQIACNQHQLIDVLDLNRNESRRSFSAVWS